VNRHYAPDQEPAQPTLALYALDPQVYEAQASRLRRLRAERDGTAVTRALSRLTQEARGTGNLMEPILDAVRAYATLGEMAAAMKDVFGEHKEAARI
jgi:methylmalonyl-CoA mutase N-terminal domain/subunit